MSRKDSESPAASTKSPTTVAEALGPLTQKAIDATKDATSKRFLQAAYDIAFGLATLLLTATDEQDLAVVKVLAKVNVGMGDVEMIVGLATEVMNAEAEREAAEAASKAATAKLEATRVKLHDGNVSFANLARSKLGMASPALGKFKIKPLGGRKGSKRAAKKTADDKKASGSGSNDSGSTK